MFKTKTVFVLLSALFILTSCSKQDPAIEQISSFIKYAKVDTSKEGWKINGLKKPPLLTFPTSSQYLWKLETNKGDILIELKAQESPMHVSSTIYLTELGYYDNIIFHRVIPGFMLQGGDPFGTGSGGPGYSYMGEFGSSLKHDKAGMISMANRGAGTDGSQFFITVTPTPHLNGKHTIFGEVIEGMETVKELEKFGTRRGKTKEKLLIKKATIIVRDND